MIKDPLTDQVGDYFNFLTRPPKATNRLSALRKPERMKKFTNCSDSNPKNHCDKKDGTFYPLKGRSANASLRRDRSIQRSAGDDFGKKALTKGPSNGWSSVRHVHLAVLLLFLFPFVCVVTGTSAPALSYALTTTVGPVVPGQGIQFTATVTNLSTVAQYVTLSYHVPEFHHQQWLSSRDRVVLRDGLRGGRCHAGGQPGLQGLERHPGAA